MIKKLDWDSNFFNLRIGEINNKTEGFDIDNCLYDLLYVKSKVEIILNSKNFKNTLSDVSVIYHKHISLHNEAECNCIIPFDANRFSIEKLYELSYVCSIYSRFNLDYAFDKEKTKKLYRKWIDNSLNGINADELLVYYENNEIKGYVSYKTEFDVVTYNMLAVSQQHQGEKIGIKLLQFVEQKMIKHNIKKLIIPTQISNVGACYIYEKMGYTIKEENFIKHYWRNDSI